MEYQLELSFRQPEHGDRAAHDRYMRVDSGVDAPNSRVLYLSRQEEKILIDALVEQRERQESAMTQTEQLLRRMTGSITEYVNAVGARPLRMNSYDKVVLAIRDGELSAFRELYPKVRKEYANDLLVEAAGRPGAVGRRMTAMLLQDVEQFSEPAYRNACKRAIDINDPEKVFSLLEQTANLVPEMPPSFYGEMASYAHPDHRFIAKEIIQQCDEKQIAAAPPHLLKQFAMDKDWHALSTLIQKGISGDAGAAETLHTLTCQRSDHWMAEALLKMRMWVNVNNYNALHACVKNDAVEVCKLLLDGGIDFKGYRLWAEAWHFSGHEETIQTLADYWAEMQQPETEQVEAQELGGQTFG